MAKRSRKFPKGVPIACAIVVAVVIMIVGFLWIHSLPMQRRMMNEANGILRRNLPGSGITLAWKDAHWRPWSEIDLEGVELRIRDRVVVRSEDVRAIYHWSSSRPYVMVDKVYLLRADIRVEVDERGRWTVPVSREGSGEAQRPVKTLPRLSPALPLICLDNTRIEVKRASRGTLILRGVSGTLRVEVIRGPRGPTLGIHLGEWEP